MLAFRVLALQDYRVHFILQIKNLRCHRYCWERGHPAIKASQRQKNLPYLGTIRYERQKNLPHLGTIRYERRDDELLFCHLQWQELEKTASPLLVLQQI